MDGGRKGDLPGGCGVSRIGHVGDAKNRRHWNSRCEKERIGGCGKDRGDGKRKRASVVYLGLLGEMGEEIVFDVIWRVVRRECLRLRDERERRIQGLRRREKAVKTKGEGWKCCLEDCR